MNFSGRCCSGRTATETYHYHHRRQGSEWRYIVQTNGHDKAQECHNTSRLGQPNSPIGLVSLRITSPDKSERDCTIRITPDNSTTKWLTSTRPHTIDAIPHLSEKNHRGIFFQKKIKKGKKIPTGKTDKALRLDEGPARVLTETEAKTKQAHRVNYLLARANEPQVFAVQRRKSDRKFLQCDAPSPPRPSVCTMSFRRTLNLSAQSRGHKSVGSVPKSKAKKNPTSTIYRLVLSYNKQNTWNRLIRAFSLSRQRKSPSDRRRRAPGHKSSSFFLSAVRWVIQPFRRVRTGTTSLGARASDQVLRRPSPCMRLSRTVRRAPGTRDWSSVERVVRERTRDT